MCAESNTETLAEQGGRIPQRCDTARLTVHDLVECCLFSKRQREVLRVIRQETLDRGWPQVFVPDLVFFAEATGLDRAEVSRAVDELDGMRVIQAPRKVANRRPGGWYGINVLFGSWAVEQRRPHVRALGLAPMYPDLNDALRMSFVELGGRVEDSERTGAFPDGFAPRGGVSATERGEGVGKIPTDLGNSQQRAEASPSAVGKIPRAATGVNVSRGETWAVGKIPRVLGKSQEGQRVSPPTPPFPKALNVERSTLNADLGCGNGEEDLLLDELQGWLGAQEMVNNGGLWRSYLRMPGGAEIVERELAQGRQLERELNPEDPRRPKSRAAWLNWYVRRQLVPGYVREKTGLRQSPG